MESGDNVAPAVAIRGWAAPAVLSLVTDSVSSPHTKRAYSGALRDFSSWLHTHGQPSFCRATVQAYKANLETNGVATSTINQHLSALRKLAREAAENGLIDFRAADSIYQIHGVRQSGFRTGRWLNRCQAQDLLSLPTESTLRGKRDRALLAVMLGCGLRRSAVSALFRARFPGQ